MKNDCIIALVVSYNGMAKTVETVMALLNQVGCIYIVDNASATASLRLLESLESIPNISITRLTENQGIGFALNLGVARAREGKFKWLLTIDQDSRADPNMINAYLRTIERHPDYACLTPNIMHRGIKEHKFSGEVSYAITSGNLVRLDVFDWIGGYNEQMFIDCVDFDFCLRARNAGFRIYRVNDAYLDHELGEPHQVSGLLGRFYTLHSPLRRYYMYRNFLLLAKLHIRNFPGFILKSAIVHLILLVLILIYDKTPLISIKAVIKGCIDFLKGRFGRCVVEF